MSKHLTILECALMLESKVKELQTERDALKAEVAELRKSRRKHIDRADLVIENSGNEITKLKAINAELLEALEKITFYRGRDY